MSHPSLRYSHHGSVSSFEADDIRDLIRTKQASPMIPNLPQRKGSLTKGKGKINKQPRERRKSMSSIGSNSRGKNRASHRRTMAMGPRGEEVEILSDTNSTTDDDDANENENENVKRPKKASLASSIKKLKEETVTSINQLREEDAYRYSSGTRRGGVRDPIKKRSLSLRRTVRRSRSREPVGKDPATNSKGAGKDLFGSESVAEKVAKFRRRARSQSRARKKEEEDEGLRNKDRSSSRNRNGRSPTRGRKKEEDTTGKRGKSLRRALSRSRQSIRSRSETRASSKTRSRSKSVKNKNGRGRSKSKIRSSSKKPVAPSKKRAQSKSRGKIEKGSTSSSNDKEIGSNSNSSTAHTKNTGGPYNKTVGSSMESDTINSMESVNSGYKPNKPKPSCLSERSPGSTTKSGSTPTSPRRRPPLKRTNSKESKGSNKSKESNKSNKSNKSADSRKNIAKPLKPAWKASIQSMFAPNNNDNPFQKKDEKLDEPTRQWQNDLSVMNEDDRSYQPSSFAKLWDYSEHRRGDNNSVSTTSELPPEPPSPPQAPPQSTSRSSPRSSPRSPRRSPPTVQTKDGGCQTDPMVNTKKPSFVQGIQQSMHEKFARYDEELNESSVQIKAFEDEVASLNDELKVKDKDVKEVKGKLLELQRRRSEAEEEIKELKAQVAELQDVLDNRAIQIETLQGQLDVAYQENSQEMYDAENKLKDYRKKIDELNESLDEKNYDIEKIQRKLDRVDREHKDQRDEDRDETDIELKDFREQVASLQEALDAKSSLVREVQAQCYDAECENKILMEELDELLKEKETAEDGAAPGGKMKNDSKNRIEELEKELEEATNVANLQLEELDEQVEGLHQKLKTERLDSSEKVKSRDATIDELTTKLRKYEAVPSNNTGSYSFQPSKHSTGHSTRHTQGSSSDSVTSDKSAGSFAGTSTAVSFGNASVPLQTPAISTDDVTDIENAKQKVYEARADATSVRESLEISTKKCAEMTLENEKLSKKNSELVDTTRERDELKDLVRDWTAQTYQWKSRAEEAESKLNKANGDNNSDDLNESDHQGMMIAAAMENRSGGGNKEKVDKKSGWSLFGRSSNPNSAHSSSRIGDTRTVSDGDASTEAKDAQIEILNETIAKLRSELVQMSTAHKEEAYLTKKRITQLEGENDALKVKNETLEQLSRFHAEN